MTDKIVYQNVVTKILALKDAMLDLDETAEDAVDYSEIFTEISDINTNLDAIQGWATDNINNLEQEELNQRLTTFLVDLKGIMQTANAKIEIVSGMPPYGESYGESDVAFKIVVENIDGSLSASHVVDQVELKAEYL